MNTEQSKETTTVENLEQLITTEAPPPGLEKKVDIAEPAPAKEPEAQVRPIAGTADIIGEDELLDPSIGHEAPPTTDPTPAPPQPAPTGEQPRKRGRPFGSKTKTTAADFSDVAQLQAVSVDYGVMASALFDMSTGTAANIFGPEWMPRSPEERNMVVEALRTYLASKQVKDIPPGLMLTIIIVAYSAPRLNAPPTREKIKFGWTFFKMKVSGIFNRRKQRHTPPPITPLNGN